MNELSLRAVSLSLLAVMGAALSGCGLTTVADNPIANSPTSQRADLEVVRVFESGVDDEDGVAIGTNAAGDPLAFYSFYVEDYVALANGGTPVGLLEVDESRLHPMRRLNASATLYEGIATIDRVRHDVRLITDDEDEAILFAYIDPDFNVALVAQGLPLYGVPSGTHTYTGTLYVYSINASNYGSFTLNADFSAETFTMTAATADATVSLTASGVIDKTEGTIGSSTATFTRSTVAGTGSIYGNLHGDRAGSVSGVFHARDTGTTVNYTGGFVGSR